MRRVRRKPAASGPAAAASGPAAAPPSAPAPPEAEKADSADADFPENDRGDETQRFSTFKVISNFLFELNSNPVFPPHSRKLNFSVLKEFLTKTALFSNKQVSELYLGYNDRDVIALELGSTSSFELRKKKSEIREYVDRHLKIKDFLELECFDGSFSAAFNQVFYSSDEKVRKLFESYTNGDLYSKLIDFDEPSSDAIKTEIINEIKMYGDFRGNIYDNNGNTDLKKPNNWYFPKTTGIPQEFIFSTPFVDTTFMQDRISLFDVALFGGLHPQTLKTIINVDIEVEPGVDTDTTEQFVGNFVQGHGLVDGTLTSTERKKQNKTGTIKLIKDEYSSRETAFFSEAMKFFDEKVAHSRNSDVSGFGRYVDLGLFLFTLEMQHPSKHTSWLNGLRDNPANQHGFYATPPNPSANTFGAPGVSPNVGVPGAYAKPRGTVGPGEEANALEQTIREEYAHEKQLYNRHVVFGFEKYCLECLERGTEMYIRILHILIKKKLQELREHQNKWLEKNSDLLRAVCKMVALTMQKSELDNPRLMAINLANMNKRKRENTFQMHEARVQLARATGETPHIDVSFSLF